MPAAGSRFVGRERELDKIISRLLASARLITLVGPGGIGKSRLAAEATRRFGKARGVSVYWVPLARLTKGSDTAAVEEEVSRSLVDADFSGRSAWELLIDTVTHTDAAGRHQQSLLVLDNCEHVLDGVVLLVNELLETVPGLSILATSREPIGWADEQVIVVPPLSQQDAVALFRQRADLAGRAIHGADQIRMVGQICKHVHGHPLYIQLAAARLPYQPLTMIVQGLSGQSDDQRLRWSQGDKPGVEVRHRGITDVISWSYNLCAAKERLLFDRLSIFAAAGYGSGDEENGKWSPAGDWGADLEAIKYVCADDSASVPDPIDRPDPDVIVAAEEIESLLERLADRSLLSVHITPTAARFALLESLRVFAGQQLREHCNGRCDESARLERRHRQYYRDKVTYAADHWLGAAEKDFLIWAGAEWSNILTAIETSISTPGDASLGLEICNGLLTLRVPFFRGSFREMRVWTERSLRAAQNMADPPAELQISAMARLAWLTLWQGDLEYAESMLEGCVAHCVSGVRRLQNWRQTAETDIGLPAPVELAWGTELFLAHGDAEAIVVLDRAREKFARLGDEGAEHSSSFFVTLAAGLVGTARQSQDFARRHLDRARASEAVWLTSWAELAWALTLTRTDEHAEALAVQRSALAHQLAIRDRWGALWAVEFRAWTLAHAIRAATADGSADPASFLTSAIEIARLIGGAKRQRAVLGIDIDKLKPFANKSAEAVDLARRVLGVEKFTAAENEGRGLDPDLNDVQRLALGALSVDGSMEQGASNDPTGSWQQLTKAEVEVAILAAAGWTNSAIAARRGNSSRTIEAQIAAVLQKLNIVTREDIIGYIPRSLVDKVRTESARRPQRSRGQGR
jgi:predicted ATPase/DNA-binding CsgD family transcriptional regulator